MARPTLSRAGPACRSTSPVIRSPIKRQPLTLIVNVLHGKTAKLRRSMNRFGPYLPAAPSAPPRATASSVGTS